MSLKRRALAPLAWLSRENARGAVAPSGPSARFHVPRLPGAAQREARVKAVGSAGGTRYNPLTITA